MLFKEKCIDVYYKYKLNDNNKMIITIELWLQKLWQLQGNSINVYVYDEYNCVRACFKIVWRFDQQSNYAGGPDIEHRLVTTND